jgi:hypothetical protein
MRSDGDELLLTSFLPPAGIHRFEVKDRAWARGDRRLEDPWFGEYPRGFTGLELGDVNGDGYDDLLAYEVKTKRVWLFVGDAQGWHLCPADTLPHEPTGRAWGIRTADLNMDGRTDVVAAFGTGVHGRVSAWFQAGSSPGRSPLPEDSVPEIAEAARKPSNEAEEP